MLAVGDGVLLVGWVLGFCALDAHRHTVSTTELANIIILSVSRASCSPPSFAPLFVGGIVVVVFIAARHCERISTSSCFGFSFFIFGFDESLRFISIYFNAYVAPVWVCVCKCSRCDSARCRYAWYDLNLFHSLSIHLSAEKRILSACFAAQNVFLDKMEKNIVITICHRSRLRRRRQRHTANEYETLENVLCEPFPVRHLVVMPANGNAASLPSKWDSDFSHANKVQIEKDTLARSRARDEWWECKKISVKSEW